MWRRRSWLCNMKKRWSAPCFTPGTAVCMSSCICSSWTSGFVNKNKPMLSIDADVAQQQLAVSVASASARPRLVVMELVKLKVQDWLVTFVLHRHPSDCLYYTHTHTQNHLPWFRSILRGHACKMKNVIKVNKKLKMHIKMQWHHLCFGFISLAQTHLTDCLTWEQFKSSTYHRYRATSHHIQPSQAEYPLVHSHHFFSVS